MLFQFKKWFFDLNSGVENYAYFIVVEIRFLCFRWHSFTFHHFREDAGTVTKTNSLRLNIRGSDWDTLQIKGRGLDISPENGQLNIAIDFDDLIIDLEINGFRGVQSAGGLMIHHGSKDIRWFPVPGSMLASGILKINGLTWKVDNEPVYIDSLYSDVLPFRVPVEKMYWGRLMYGELRIAYSVVMSDKGQQWSRCFVTLEGRHFTFPAITLEITAGTTGSPDDDKEGSGYVLTAMDGDNRLVMAIHHRKVVAEGQFIDPDQYRNKLLIRALGRISKNPGGRKFLSTADVQMQTGGVSCHWPGLVGVDEFVEFSF